MSMFKMNIVESKLFGFDHISQPIKVLSMKVNPYLAHKNKPKDSERIEILKWSLMNNL